ncbi:hypothetical protein [Leptospira alexanderi]|uniref:hypothetical protein n=1 Tax=Leptospira alexanderi TaxID=100053 RepID=UPI00147A1430|nr:hypothetical protein [Leptospira alexanderi]
MLRKQGFADSEITAMDYHTISSNLLAIRVLELEEDLQWVHRIKMINPEIIKHIEPFAAELEKQIQDLKIGWSPIVPWSQKTQEEKQRIIDKYRNKNMANWQAMQTEFKDKMKDLKANK